MVMSLKNAFSTFPMRVTGPPTTADGYEWYPVVINNGGNGLQKIVANQNLQQGHSYHYLGGEATVSKNIEMVVKRLFQNGSNPH
jgi:hypothetical protein